MPILTRRATVEGDALALRHAAIAAEADPADRWTSRARPGFLYVMYALLLWAIPMGLIAAAQPAMAKDIADSKICIGCTGCDHSPALTSSFSLNCASLAGL